MTNIVEQVLVPLQQVGGYRLLKMGEGYLTVGALVQLLAMIALVFLAEALVRRQLVRRVLQRTRMQPSLQFAIARIGGYAFIALGCYVALQIVGVNLTSLAVVAGAIGVGIGFGLQNVVQNFVSGIIILAERPITIGDRVEVSGVAGQVRQIRLRSTTIITNDNIAYIVPNSDFITGTVINWSHGDPRVRIRLKVGVAYGSDVQKLERLLLEIAQEHPKVLSEPKPAVFFNGFGESSLDFEFAVWTSEMTFSPRRFRSELFFAIERKLRENNIEIPFPQRDLHLRSGEFVLRPPPDNEEKKPGGQEPT